jgi:hypothetical protein
VGPSCSWGFLGVFFPCFHIIRFAPVACGLPKKAEHNDEALRTNGPFFGDILHGWLDTVIVLLKVSVVKTYSDAIVHFVIEIAQLLRGNKDIPIILHKGITEAFMRHGIYLKLHHRHRSDGEEVMSREEASGIHEQLAGMGTVQGWLGQKRATAMAFLDRFESSHQGECTD